MSHSLHLVEVKAIEQTVDNRRNRQTDRETDKQTKFEGSGPERYILNMLYTGDIPFWPGTLEIMSVCLAASTVCLPLCSSNFCLCSSSLPISLPPWPSVCLSIFIPICVCISVCVYLFIEWESQQAPTVCDARANLAGRVKRSKVAGCACLAVV